MGTLFIRFVEEGLKFRELKHYLLEEISARTPSGLIKKDRAATMHNSGKEGIRHVSPGDLVVITHQKGYSGKSGVVAIGRATTHCLTYGEDVTNPPLGPTEPFAVAVESIEWIAGQIPTTEKLRPALKKYDSELKMIGPGWRYSTVDMNACIQDLLKSVQME